MLHDLRDAVAEDSGGKAAALGTLLRAGFEVPPGVVVPVQEYRRHLDRHALDPRSVVPEQLRERILGGALDDALTAAFELELRPSRGRALGPQVAVRSSATTEDTAGASAAGQHESLLAVQGSEAVRAAVLQCWASLWSRHAVDYRQASTTEDAPPPEMAVIVQRFVEPDVSGVLFAGEESTLEAVRGRGEQLVGGALTPESWRIGAEGILERRFGDGTRAGDGPRRAPCLSDAQVHELVTLGDQISSVLGTAADVEWALLDDRLHVLQARPITAAVPHAPRGGRPAPGALQGTPAGRGVVTGTARHVRGPQDFRRVQPGDVLVCHATDPAWTPLFRVAAAVVTESGGVLSHAAIVARELGIPAVLAVPAAMTGIPDGALVTVDGDGGIIRR